MPQVLTKAWTAALLNAVGDILAQTAVERNERLDLKRLGIFSFLGFVLVGPALHFWYQTLGRVVTATGTGGAVQRMLLDQLLFAPFFLSTFIASLMTLEGHAGGVQAKLRQDLRPTLVANWKVWVPFQLLNFRFVPPSLQARPSQGTGRCLGGAAARALPGLLHRPASDRPGMSRLRVLASNVVAVGWNTYMSMASHSAVAPA